MLMNPNSSTISTIESFTDEEIESSEKSNHSQASNQSDVKFNNYRLISINSNLNSNIRENLKQNLATDYCSLLKTKQSRFSDQQIIINEKTLIDESLMILSGLKPNLIFQFADNEIRINPRFRLQHLDKELYDSLKTVIHYAQVVNKLEDFVENSTNQKLEYTQTYAAFAQCITEFLKYFKQNLNSIGTCLIKKEIKFTLIDFLARIRDPYYKIFNLLDQFLHRIKEDESKEAHVKSTSLLATIHKYLIESYSLNLQDKSVVCKFLMWLFVRTIKPYLIILNSFIRDDDSEVTKFTKFELGIKRNLDITINNPRYWTHGYEISPSLQSVSKFIDIIVKSAFKISKHMEIVKLIGDFNYEANIYESFKENIFKICPYLVNTPEQAIESKTELDEIQLTLLDINFNQLKEFSNNKTITQLTREMNQELVPIDKLMSNSSEKSIINVNLEQKIEEALSELLVKNVEWSSTILVEKLFNKYQMCKFFDFLQSYYLFKSNEIMFIFSKKLFSTIKQKEQYKEDAILNSIFYHSSHSVFTTTELMLKSYFSSNLVTVHYEKSINELNNQLQVNGIKLNVQVVWPLNIIVQGQNFDTYNTIFIFLLKIKQAKFELDNLDLKDMDLKRCANKSDIDEQAVNKMLVIRFKLMNFINSIHDLVCNQVYESCDDFLNLLKKQTVIDEIIQLHERFLFKTLKSCMIHAVNFQQVLAKILNLTLLFSDMWSKSIAFLNSSKLLVVIELEKNIDVYFEFIYKILSSLLNRNQSLHFQPLISALL